MEISCGTVLYTISDNKPLYVLVKAHGDGYCGFPKGHMERGETETQTALRETLEETSVRAEIDTGFRRTTSYQISFGQIKKVIYFVASYFDQTPQIDPEFETGEIFVLPYEKALFEITFENTKQILREANSYIMKKHGL